MNGETLTLQDALKLQGPLAFNLMLKPAGSLCNLDCHYCYYLDKAEIYGGREPRLTEDGLERFVKRYIESCEVPEVCFNWHGGEPLVMGLDFYRKAVILQKRYADGKTVHNTLQTNGTLITDEWSRFLAGEGWLTGVSIDGPREVHDKYRKDKGGAPTFDRVLRGLESLNRCGAEYNLMSTVNHASEGRGAEVYGFLKGLGSRFMQFSPVVEHVTGDKQRPHIVPPDTEGARLAPWSVSAIAYGKFLCDIFDIWVRRDVGEYYVNVFDCTLANWCGVRPGTCSFAETCGDNCVVEHNGDIYCCDHFVYPQWRLGNLYEDSLKLLMTSEKQIKFGISKREGLPAQCRGCQWWQQCHGGCPKHRFGRTRSGQEGLNALCEGYRKFFAHTAPAMKRMRELLENGQAPALVML